MRLIGEMAQAGDDSLRLAGLIGEHESQIDEEFFALLAANIQLAEQSMQADTVEQLTQLRQALIERTEAGRKVGEQEKALQTALADIGEDLTRDQLLDRVAAVQDEHSEQVLSVLLALARPLVDYQFFQLLTRRIEAAEKSGDQRTADQLKGRRSLILDLAQRMDAEIREQTQAKALLLREILQSASPKDVIRAHLDEIDSVFLSVLEANVAQSGEQGQAEATERLRSIRNLIVEVMQESAPPEIRLINQLLQAEYPDGTRQMLRDNQAMLSDEFITLFDVLAQDLSERGDTETSERLLQIRAQAELLSVQVRA
jgi:hypothetical protein